MLVSIITVCHNGEDFIRNCVESVTIQDYDQIEHILVDNRSDDSSVSIFKKYSRTGSSYISEKDNGIYDAMNKGIMMAKGEVVGFLNTDDVFSDSNIVSKIVENMDGDIDCIYANLTYVNRNGFQTRNWISKPYTSGLFAQSWSPAHPTFYCRKNIYDKYGYYRTDYTIASDVDLMYRFLEKYKIKSKYVNYNFVKMLEGGVSNKSIKSTIKITKEVLNTLRENGVNINFFYYLFFKLVKVFNQKYISINRIE